MKSLPKMNTDEYRYIDTPSARLAFASRVQLNLDMIANTLQQNSISLAISENIRKFFE